MTTPNVGLLSILALSACLLPGCQARPTESQAPKQPAVVPDPPQPPRMTRDWRISPTTGDDFTEDCSSKDPALKILCQGYLVGALDMLDSLEATTKIPNLTCVPTDVTGDQMAKVVVKYGTDHPEELHLQGSAFLLKAFGEAWPCTEETK